MLLTGTPLQNSLDELFALLHFLAPSKFTPAASEAFAAEKIDSEAKCARLRDMLQPHMLRRRPCSFTFRQTPPAHRCVIAL